MAFTVSNVTAIVTVCCTLLSGAYGLVISPLKKDMEIHQQQLAEARRSEQVVRLNQEKLKKYDIRIDQNRQQIQLQAISSAKQTVQVEHLAEAIKELNVILKGMKDDKGN